MAGAVLLARHGETDDNVQPLRFPGFADTRLNDTGRRQAHELAQRVESEGIRSLWCSDLSRAAETAAIVGEHLGLRPRFDSRLREGDRGFWEGRLFAEVQRDEPEAYAAWRRGGAEWRFPGGESLREHQERVAAAIDDIRMGGQLPALVVCHGGSIRVMLCQREPEGLAAFHKFELPNTVVVRL